MNVFELAGTIAINNKEANSALKDTAQKAEKAGKQIQEAFKKVGSATVKAGKWAIGTATAISAAFVATAETTRDYRTAMGKLDAAFTTNGHSAETAIKTYKALQSVLGETDQAVEAANHLAVLCDNEKDLSTWTDICTGVFATFGDSLPIEGLTESANETAKVRQVTGSLADALNWAGISEEDFNLKLRACTTDQEAQDLIMNTLIGTYKAAADQYRETNAEVIKANEAQENLTSAMSKLGDVFEPVVTSFKNWMADMVNTSIPHIDTLISKFSEIENVWTEVIWPLTQDLFKVGFDIDLPDWETVTSDISEGWQEIQDKIRDFFRVNFSIDMPSWSEVTNSIKTGWNSVKASIAGLFHIDATVTPTVTGSFGGGGNGVSGAEYGRTFGGSPTRTPTSRAVGLDEVPYDGYYAHLHKGEAILNKAQADQWRGGSSGKVEALLAQLVANTSGGQMVVLDSGVLVGQIASQMDTKLGTIGNRKGRGN